MRILLVNVDSRWNMAIRKMYNYFRSDYEVEMRDLGLSGYPHNKRVTIDAADFDRVYVSNIFDNNADRVEVINCDDVVFGGIGSRDPHRQLPPEIESTAPYYFPEESTSYGFITRGCIRNCWFCKVPKYEGKLKAYNSVQSIVRGVPSEVVKFLDNNILAYPHHMEVFQWLIEQGTRCEFNQGLDFRLVNDENLDALSRLNYEGAYIFAFDEPRYQPILDKKLVLMKKYISRPWALKFYIYYHPDMNLAELLDRVEWCRRNECLPYIMRDRACWECEPSKRSFLIDYTSYCNQAGLFKKLTFEQFMEKRTKNEERRRSSLAIYKQIRRDKNDH